MITDDPEALLDLSKMKTLLINMFREVDDDNNGYLTFDEFQVCVVVTCYSSLNHYAFVMRCSSLNHCTLLIFMSSCLTHL